MALPKRLEKSIENPVVAWAKKQGIRRVMKLNGMGNRSMPDRMFFIPGGRPFLIEFKRPGCVPTELQTHTITELIEDGYDVEVHDTVLGAKAAITKRLEEARAPRSKK